MAKHLWNQATEFAQEDRVRLGAEAVLFIGAVVVLGLLELEGGADIAIFTLLVTGIISIETMQSRVDDLERLIRGPGEVLESKTDVDEQITDYIKTRAPDDVYLLEYSSDNAETVVETALEHGCDVYLLIRHPGRETRWDVSKSQADTIKNRIHELERKCTDLARENDEYDLHLRFYYHQASLRARRIDDDILFVSWYMFDNRMGKSPRRKHVQGHNNPMLVFADEADGYSELNEMFEHTFYSLWFQGRDIEYVFENDEWDGLNDWVVDEHEGERKEQRRKEWMREVSGLDADELFPDSGYVPEVSDRIDTVDPSFFLTDE